MFSIFKKKTPLEASITEVRKQAKLIEKLQKDLGKASLVIPDVASVTTWTSGDTISINPGHLISYSGAMPIIPYWDDSSYIENIPMDALEKELAKRRAKEADVQFKLDLKDILEET